MTRRRLSLLVPLAGFVVPSVAIGYGVVIPRSCITGWNEHTLGRSRVAFSQAGRPDLREVE